MKQISIIEKVAINEQEVYLIFKDDTWYLAAYPEDHYLAIDKELLEYALSKMCLKKKKVTK